MIQRRKSSLDQSVNRPEENQSGNQNEDSGDYLQHFDAFPATVQRFARLLDGRCTTKAFCRVGKGILFSSIGLLRECHVCVHCTHVGMVRSSVYGARRRMPMDYSHVMRLALGRLDRKL